MGDITMAKKKILLVDDEVSLTRMMRLNLEAEGNYEVMVVNEGAKALEAAQLFQPDLIFLDLVMPGVGGSEVARYIQNDGKLKDTPIIFLTATVTREETGIHGDGGEVFLAKPATVKEIIKCIEEHVK
jgi:CheY-like chemotaxis protein